MVCATPPLRGVSCEVRWRCLLESLQQGLATNRGRDLGRLHLASNLIPGNVRWRIKLDGCRNRIGRTLKSRLEVKSYTIKAYSPESHVFRVQALGRIQHEDESGANQRHEAVVDHSVAQHEVGTSQPCAAGSRSPVLRLSGSAARKCRGVVYTCSALVGRGGWRSSTARSRRLGAHAGRPADARCGRVKRLGRAVERGQNRSGHLSPKFRLQVVPVDHDDGRQQALLNIDDGMNCERR